MGALRNIEIPQEAGPCGTVLGADEVSARFLCQHVPGHDREPLWGLQRGLVFQRRSTKFLDKKQPSHTSLQNPKSHPLTLPTPRQIVGLESFFGMRMSKKTAGADDAAQLGRFEKKSDT